MVDRAEFQSYNTGNTNLALIIMSNRAARIETRVLPVIKDTAELAAAAGYPPVSLIEKPLIKESQSYWLPGRRYRAIGVSALEICSASSQQRM